MRKHESSRGRVLQPGRRYARRLRRRLGVGIYALSLGLCTAASQAHHSVRANFEMQRPTEIEGTVTTVSIRNPHSQYTLDVEGLDGTAVEWLVEWSDRNALIRRQVAIDRIKVGDRIKITVWPSKLLENVGYFVQAEFPDGSIFRDCGFAEFRQAVVNSTEFSCEEARGR